MTNVRRHLPPLALALAAVLCPVAGRAAPRKERSGPLPLARLAVDIDIDEHLGAGVPLEQRFTDQQGRAVRLGDVMAHGRPVLLVLAYYRCPMLCDLVLRGLAQALAQVGWVPGQELQAITVSIDPKDTPAAARLKQGHVLQVLGHSEATDGWRFLVGPAESSRRLADAIGFRYVYDPRSDQYAHAAAAVVLTPDGRIARYVYGVDFRPFDLRMALVEAGRGSVARAPGGAIERVLLTCFRYDPSTRRYGLYVVGLLKGGGALVLATVALCLLGLWRRDRQRQREEHAAAGAPAEDPRPW
jgi:protein SCO1/2